MPLVVCWSLEPLEVFTLVALYLVDYYAFTSDAAW